jgi:hypothetical protein
MNTGVLNISDGISVQPDSYYVGAVSDNMTTTGNVAYTGIGFSPKAVWFMVGPPSGGGLTYAGFGQMDGTNMNFLKCNRNNVNDDWSANISAAVATTAENAGNWNGTFVSFDSDGFTLFYVNSGSASGTVRVQFIAFK